MRDPMERRQTSVIIEARPKVLLGAAVFIFYMGVKVGRASQQQDLMSAAKKMRDGVFDTEPKVRR